MWTPRWLLALPLALAAMIGTASASSVRDQAGMFSPDAVRQAEADLNRVERQYGIPTTIETIDSLDGADIANTTLERAKRSGTRGIYILIANKEKKIWDEVWRGAIPPDRQRALRQAFAAGFKKGDFDAGLLQGVKEIGTEVAATVAEKGTRRSQPGALPPGRAGRGNGKGGFGIGSLLGIGLLIVGVLFVVRLLGGLFGGGGSRQPGRMGAPGYGAPGYGGGGGGGFMSSLFGGIGGALAGNWLYDQFSGRHHGGYSDSSAMGGDASQSPASGGDDWSGGGTDWGGGDTGGGGGDWGGGGDGGDW
jgi:hypothetical protein